MKAGDQSACFQCRAMIWSRLDFDHQEIHKATTQAIDQMALSLENAFCELMKVDTNSKRFRQIQATLTKATSLARKFMQQRACYVFEYPTAIFGEVARFNSDIMCDLLGGEKREWNGRMVQLEISPAVTKFGNEKGEEVGLERTSMKGTC